MLLRRGKALSDQARTAELLLIRTEPPCSRCRKAEVVLREVVSSHPGVATLRVIRSDEPEAQKYGPILTPVVLLNGKLICAGMAPLKSGLEKLVEAELKSDAG